MHGVHGIGTWPSTSLRFFYCGPELGAPSQKKPLWPSRLDMDRVMRRLIFCGARCALASDDERHSDINLCPLVGCFYAAPVSQV